MMRASIFLLVSGHIASVAPKFSQAISARACTFSLVAARMTIVVIKRVNPTVQSIHHVEAGLAWVVVEMYMHDQCDLHRSRNIGADRARNEIDIARAGHLDLDRTLAWNALGQQVLRDCTKNRDSMGMQR